MNTADDHNVNDDESNIDPEGDDAAEAPEDTEATSPLALMKDERDKLKDQLLRVAADFDNYRKRARKDVEEGERRAKEDVLREVLPVIDNLERAVQAATSTTEVSSIVDGIKMVLRLFEDQATRIGLVRMVAVGERFDPALHDAIQQVETDEHPPGTVITEIVPGYRIGEKLVRPAMVVVARKPAASA